ncbi:potassium-transporting ATPase subunit KdpA [Mesorhizobium sp. M7A.F.Ca.AU.002.02.1.1]|uniref:potassium-transporting ATPase subunit KdpA n=1 Tax=Mesorhizobium sp. M7A.F.Ca.AU.002.02.1.1 TaxID=2496671 RepID=UPI000FCA9A55|nr:potassium-transporting ATPase subunit KdpA [Mesorhizobium sp. M7A.F.Ca.AU.002.02.1.1]RVC23517.1 potassium-transporting ATPase subunit KdpA [Mesorhizobium sp. M7A.F.Ca.AU.002.02.1.1]
MTLNGWIQILVYCGIVILLVKPLGGYMHRVFDGDRTLLSPVFGPLERGLYRVCGTSEREEQHWTTYAVALLLFNLAGFLVLYALQRLQGSLPYNPAGMTAVEPGLAFNTAASFMTNTNWQNYGGESTMSYLVQMAGLTVQNFVSAATGIAIAIALIRGFARASGKSIGNFWVDMTRSTLYLLLPFCVVLTLASFFLFLPPPLCSSVPSPPLSFSPPPLSFFPFSSPFSLPLLFPPCFFFFPSTAAPPFEHPDAISNLIQMVSIFAIGAALTNVFGRMIGNQRQGWAILSAMGVMFIAGVAICYWAEAAGNPLVHALGIDGGNMEGKETRFGIALSALFAVITTAASCGAVNAMHGSFTALGGMIPIINMQLGEVIVGGVGAGLYGILMYIVVAVFVAGLMVGRTPEYLGKKIEAKEVKMAMLAILCLPLAMLIFTAIAVVLPTGVASMGNAGPHGFSEVLYAYTSAAANNGSAFGGLSGNTPWYNITIGIGMLMGRFLVIISALAIAGSLVAKKTVPASAGTFPTDGPLFVGLLIGVILIVGGLTFFPALAVGPIIEHLAMAHGQTF